MMNEAECDALLANDVNITQRWITGGGDDMIFSALKECEKKYE